MKTLHSNIVDSSGRIYCYKHDVLTMLINGFIEKNCLKCSYFRDTLQGTGVACEFDDGCNEKSITFDDAGDSELHCKMQFVRLGLKTKDEVINSLKSYNQYDDESENKEEKDDEAPPPKEENEEEK